MTNFKKTNRLIGITLFFLSTAVYLYTLEPTASFWDSGEFIAASYKLEIPHPPGAPLFLLVGRIFSLFAFDNPELIAYSVNALSAVSSGLAVMFLYWIIVMVSEQVMKNQTKPWTYAIAGISGALAFAFSDSFWFSATETEVYALSTFMTAFVVWAMLKWNKLHDTAEENRWLILIAYVMGLSVGVHLLNLVAIPALALIYYFKKSKKTSFWGGIGALSIGSAFLLFVLYGLVSYANLIKYAELFFVNSLGFGFGMGAIALSVLLLAAWIYGIYKSQMKNQVKLNTLLLAMGFVIIGYSSYTVVMIRSNFYPPINQNQPDDVLKLIYYLNMEQYPTRPLLYGKNFNAELIDQVQGKKMYETGQDKYEVKDHKIEYVYDDKDMTILPRMYSSIQANHPAAYREIMGLKKGQKPTFADHMTYMIKHQLGHMYFRYFLWNFAGRESSVEGAGWMTPLDELNVLPTALATDEARNQYYMLPLFIGMLGMLFMYYRNTRQFAVVGMLFFMTGMAIVLYLNSPPVEPRERDYIYVGSYMAYCIWIGIGMLSLLSWSQRLSKHRVVMAVAVSLMALSIPIMMLLENFDDHNRKDRYFSVDQAKNMLSSCEPNAILFTGGDNDTYPLWYAQEVEGFRTDVRVVVLSYANVDWYIDQFYAQMNESDPLPLSLSKKNYKQGGLNDYVLHMPNPRVTGAVSARQYLALVKKENKALQLQYGFSKMNSLPTDRFYVKTRLEDVDGIIPEIATNLVVDKFELKVKGRGLEKKDMLIMDLIDSNRWQRPIYFNHTSLNAIGFDLTPNVVQEGSTYRLLPVVNPKDDTILVNEDKMFDNLVVNGQWRNLDDPDVYYNDYYKSYIMSQRSNFNTLAKALIDTGKVEMAKNTLDKSLKLFPDESVPFDISSVQTTALLLTVHDKDSADQIARKLVERSDEMLTYMHNENISDRMSLSRHLYTLRELAIMYSRHGFKTQGTEFAELFEEHYKKLAG